jgi:hypothetical protein
MERCSLHGEDQPYKLPALIASFIAEPRKAA